MIESTVSWSQGWEKFKIGKEGITNFKKNSNKSDHSNNKRKLLKIDAAVKSDKTKNSNIW